MDYEGHPCTSCGKKRTYTSKQVVAKSKGNNCKSCANSMSNGGTGLSYDKGGNRLCAHCKKNRARSNNSLCQPCSSTDLSKRFQARYRYERYGVNKEWFDARFKGSCEICDKEISVSETHIDHCHSTNKVRGLICGLCNKGLGQFKDNLELLKRAVNYLETNSG